MARVEAKVSVRVCMASRRPFLPDYMIGYLFAANSLELSVVMLATPQ